MTIAPWAVEPESSEEEDRPFTILNDSMADWAMAKLSAAQGEMAAVQAQYDEWRESLDTWLGSVYKKPEDTYLYMTALLCDYACRQREETGEATLSLPSGKVTSRRNPERVVLEDPQAVLAWLHTLDPDVTRDIIAESVRISELRRLVKVHDGQAVAVTGEVPAGLAVEPETLSFTVKVSTPGGAA